MNQHIIDILSQIHNLSLFVVFGNLNQLCIHSLKLFAFSSLVFIVNGDMNHNCSIKGHSTSPCNIVSSLFLHIEHVVWVFIFLLIRFIFVGMASLHAFQIKCLIFWGIFKFHSLFHGKFLRTLLLFKLLFLSDI